MSDAQERIDDIRAELEAIDATRSTLAKLAAKPFDAADLALRLEVAKVDVLCEIHDRLAELVGMVGEVGAAGQDGFAAVRVREVDP